MSAMCAFGALWAGSLILCFKGKRRSSPVMFLSGATFLTLLTSFGIWFVFFFAPDYLKSSTPQEMYEAAFDFAPSPDVSDIKSGEYGFADNSQTYLRFRASAPTIHKIVSLGFIPTTRAKAQSQGLTSGSNVPAWWKPFDTKSTRFYIVSNRLKRFTTYEVELLCYDSQTRIAWYQYVGLD